MNMPDPQQPGGRAWVRRTGGRLSGFERRLLASAERLRWGQVDIDGAIGCYLHSGASPGSVDAVLRRYPRGDFKRQGAAAVRATRGFWGMGH